MPKPLPKVLFITPAAFNGLTGGGITFSNLFRGWPKDRLATVHSDPVPTTDDVCNRYFPLTDSELRLPAAMRWIAQATGARSNGTAQVAAAAAVPAQSGPSLRHRVQSLLFQAELPRSGVLSPALERWIDQFQPDVLYSILGSNGMMELVQRVRDRFRLPLVVHMMDDWPSHANRHGLLAPVLRARMQHLLGDIVSHAALRIAICDAMAHEYGRRWGAPFAAIHNAVDGPRWRPLQRHGAASSGHGDLLYVGSIASFAQLASLVDLCKAVERLSQRGEAVTLTIASPTFQIAPVRHQLEVGSSIRIVPPIEDDEEFYRRIAAADGLVLPVNFDEESVRFIRYSMPTKVPAYLFSGTPILVYGPREVAQVSYAARDGWGLVVDRRDDTVLDGAILTLIGDESLRSRLSETGKRLAAARHDLNAVRHSFQDMLSGVA